jgi:hypothetical protein
MKRTLLAIALCSACAGYAVAQDEEVLAPVVVEHVDGYRIVENCTPPASAPECASFHALIRQHFSDREIGMLFGAATAYPEYRTSYDSVRERYDNLVRYVEDNGVPALATVDEPITVIQEPPRDVVYSRAPIEDRSDVINDDDAVILDDDPDENVLTTTSLTDPDYTSGDEVVYYDDDGTPRPRRE